jgi:hypothetical protein
MPTVDPRDAELAALERDLAELFELAKSGAYDSDEPREHWVARKLRLIAEDALRTRPEPLAGSGVAGELEALACDCDSGEDNNWEDHEWRDTAALLRSAAAALRAHPPEPVAASGVAGEIPRLPRDQLLYGSPDYLDDPDGLARWREVSKQHGGHDKAPINIHSLRRLLDTIERLRSALRAHPAPDQSAHCSGEVVEGLRIAAGIVESDLCAAEETKDADWEGQSREALDAVNSAIAALSAPRPDEGVEALREIAAQKLPDELDNPEDADWREGYVGCVERARAALSRLTTPEKRP